MLGGETGARGIAHCSELGSPQMPRLELVAEAA